VLLLVVAALVILAVWLGLKVSGFLFLLLIAALVVLIFWIVAGRGTRV
jgi:hypothetical protein